MIEGILDALELAKEIGDVVISLSESSKTLEGRNRSMVIKVYNKTQFKLIFTASHEDWGKLWKAPTNIDEFSAMTFSAADSDGTILTGLQGGAAFRLEMPEEGGETETLDIAIGFDNPEIGSEKTCVIFSDSPKKAADDVKKDGHSALSKTYKGKNVKGEDVTIQFRIASVPAQENTNIIITQLLVD
ncbi:MULTISPECIES: hypothetical protein [unclassified Aureispira]|uniref:hypothetical protein n=1 Tax=unclassified Aureispira TaxID=2649989 RepID=UPI0006981234|nr:MULTISPECIES: hypothetical protein [unclassified Aureispira]WMX12010.1 hypothetical protein QP953_14380 [Aureispira sp. CCB-E]